MINNGTIDNSKDNKNDYEVNISLIKSSTKMKVKYNIL